MVYQYPSHGERGWVVHFKTIFLFYKIIYYLCYNNSILIRVLRASYWIPVNNKNKQI